MYRIYIRRKKYKLHSLEFRNKFKIPINFFHHVTIKKIFYKCHSKFHVVRYRKIEFLNKLKTKRVTQYFLKVL